MFCKVAVSVAALILFPSSVRSLEKERLDQLIEVMVTGCSLGQSIAVEVEGDGGISFFKKGVKGSFKASRDEIPSIIRFLGTDESKRAVSQDTRECMQRYMDRIFTLLENEASTTDTDEKRQYLAKKFAGFWANEGVIDSEDTHYMCLELEVAKNEIRGELTARSLLDKSTWHGVSISGKGQKNEAKVSLIKVTQGRVDTLAEVSLTLRESAFEGSDSLIWKVHSGLGPEHFPNKTTLFKYTPHKQPFSCMDMY